MLNISKNYLWVFCVFFTLTHTFNAQKHLSPEETHTDLEIFKRVLRNGHPSLYEYTDKSILNPYLNQTKKIDSSIKNDVQLYHHLQMIAGHIKDGNLRIQAPNKKKFSKTGFPLIVKIIQSELYTDTKDFDIPVGSKITTINKISIDVVLSKLKKQVVVDGNNLYAQHRQIEKEFALLYNYSYGIQKNFEIAYITPQSDTITKKLDATSFVDIEHRTTLRNSYFANYHFRKNNLDFYNEFIGNKLPYIYFKEQLSTAILVINSFEGESKSFKKRLVNLFQTIQKQKSKHLIIDIRRASFGSRANAIQLFSFLSRKNFKEQQNSFVNTLSVPEKEYATFNLSEEKELLYHRYYHNPVYDGWSLNFDDLQSIMISNKDAFKGNIYILMSGTTAGAAASLSLLSQNSNDMISIGEPCNRGALSHTDTFPVLYKLPNSKINFSMNLERIEHYRTSNNTSQSMIIEPDKYVSLTRDDLILGRDTVLRYALKLISK